MALIKCPECGRENVSDTAEMCPECGYGIKTHYDKVKQEKKKEELYNYKLKNVSKPEMPKRLNIIEFKFAIAFVILCFISLLLAFSDSTFFIFFFLMLFGIFIFFYDADKKYNEAVRKYELAMNDFEKYQKEIVREQEEQARKEAAKPKCPVCNSTNIEKISTTSRAVSVATVGLASGKIGKQYKCNNCKHMW